eukprot:3485143-Alexandrium_andersonii.AAC.1
MSASLVGSEMCIRDSPSATLIPAEMTAPTPGVSQLARLAADLLQRIDADRGTSPPLPRQVLHHLRPPLTRREEPRAAAGSAPPADLCPAGVVGEADTAIAIADAPGARGEPPEVLATGAAAPDTPRPRTLLGHSHCGLHAANPQ